MTARTRLVGADARSEPFPEAGEDVPRPPPAERVPGTTVVQVVQRAALTDFAKRVAAVLPSLRAEPSGREIYEALTTDPRVLALFYRSDETRIGAAMAALGYRPRQRTEGGRRLRRYELRQPAPAGTQPSGSRGTTHESPELRESNSGNDPKGRGT